MSIGGPHTGNHSHGYQYHNCGQWLDTGAAGDYLAELPTMKTNYFLIGGNNCNCSGSGNWLSSLISGVVGLGTGIALTAMMNKNASANGVSIFGSGFAGNNYSFYPTGFVGSQTNSGMINFSGLLPWVPTITPTTTTTTEGATTAGSTTAGSTTAGSTTDGSTTSGSTTSGSTTSGSKPSADDFRTAIDGKASAEVINSQHNDYVKITSEDNVDGVKKGIAKGATYPAGESADTKVDGYYKYITITSKTSKNQYTYEYVSSTGNQLKYKFNPTLTNTDIDNKDGDDGWEKSELKPIYVVTIDADGNIKLTSDGDDYCATATGKKT